ncbi:hypothetical protein EYR41_007687 [Orbilia oligospora]|uniref:DUF7587 domain-containing protein n=1 Tax=Orbilia oligospora TaxID=2813651 RepID=A0A7C8KRG8_ORBOL|nr:hypothetical protein TWF751_007067 [Orbilia oligospora]TGJ66026.1 hypothetical protein EYR41_007687 [Orbilia oligospora]
MDQHRLLSGQKPGLVYRVHYQGSATEYGENGFAAGDRSMIPSIDKTGFYHMVDEHLRWRSRVLSRFISVFSDRKHAERWARVWQGNNMELDHTVYLVTIKPSEDDVMFSVGEILETRGLQKGRQRDEYLFLSRIPVDSVVGVERVFSKDDICEYDPMLGYSSDDSAVANNINDDVIKVIEGFWDY